VEQMGDGQVMALLQPGEAAEVGQALAFFLSHVIAVGQVRRRDGGEPAVTAGRCRATSATASLMSLWSRMASRVSPSAAANAAPRRQRHACPTGGRCRFPGKARPGIGGALLSGTGLMFR